MDRSIFLTMMVLAGWLAAVAPALGQGGATTPSQQMLADPEPITTATLNVEELLSDPYAHADQLRQIKTQRVRLALLDDNLPAIEDQAQRFAQQGAYYPAISLLWFADKMTTSTAQRVSYNEQMQKWLEKHSQLDSDIDAAAQLLAAGRPDAAMAELKRLNQAYPFNEKVYYQTGLLAYETYSRHMPKTKEEELPLDTRARLFRICFEQYYATLVLDPLFGDAWEGLNRSRDMIPESPEFLSNSQYLTRYAFKFVTDVTPAIGALEDGDRSPKALSETGQALEGMGLYAYAVFAYQAALNQSPADASPESLKELRDAITRLRDEKLRRK